MDAEQTPQFEPEFLDEAAWSCRRWLTVNPMETDLAVAGEALVRYTLRVPSDALPRSYHCAAGFTSTPPADNPTGMGLQTAVRVVAAFYVIVGNPAISIPAALEPICGQIAATAQHAPWRYTMLSGLIPALPLVIIRPFLPESPVWAEKRKAGTLKRPSIGEIFSPQLRRSVRPNVGYSFDAVEPADLSSAGR